MNKCSKWLTSIAMTTILTTASSVWAQAPAIVNRAAEKTPRDFGTSVLSTILFGVLGIVLAIVGFKLFDLAVKFDFEKEICEKQNLAVAVLCGFMMLGICIIIAATVMS